METKPGVNITALYAALDAARQAQALSWRGLAKELHLSPSTLSRMANGYSPDISAFAVMTSWLHMPAETFYSDTTNHDEEPELTAALAPLLRARRDLSAEDVDYLQDVIGAAVRRFQADKAH